MRSTENLKLLWTLSLTCGIVAAQSVQQAAPPPNRNITAPGPQRHSPPSQQQSPPPGATAPQPIRQTLNNGTIEGFVYWDTRAVSHVPAGSCSGLSVAVAVENSSGGSYVPLATVTNNFKYVGQVKQFIAGGKVKTYDVCTYGYDKVPVGPNIKVSVIASPNAFSPAAAPQGFSGPINIINGQCNMLPRIVNPTASDLFSHWGTCQNMAYDMNFEVTQASKFLSSSGSGASQQQTAGAQVGKNPGPGGTQLLNGGSNGQLLNSSGSGGTSTLRNPGPPGTPTTKQPGPNGAQAQPFTGGVKTGSDGGFNGGSQQGITDITNRGTPALSGNAASATPGSKVELNPQPFPPKQALTNRDVLSMLNAGLAESVIVSSLRSSQHKFDFSPTSCRDLQRAHVTVNILNAMGDGSTRPCPELPGPRSANSSDVTGKKPAPTALKPVKLAPPTALRKVTNPLVAQQNASIIAVLQQQKLAADREFSAIKDAVRSVAAARAPAFSAGFQGSAPVQGLKPTQTQSAHGTSTSSIALAPAFNSVVLACSNDPTPRILKVNGGEAPGIFTPEAKYNQYTIVGCSFGQSQGTARIFGVNGFSANLNIDFWSDNGVTAHLDPWLAGVLDQNNISLVVLPVGKQQIQKSGFRFYAARGMPAPNGSDQEVPLAYDSMSQSSVQLYGASPVVAGWNQLPSNAASQFPSFSFQGTPVAGWIFRYAYGHRDDSYPIKVPCYVNDVASNPDKACGGYFDSIGFAPAATDTWDFSKLVTGFSVSSYELFYANTAASDLCGAWDDGGKHSGLAGSWNSNLTSQNQIAVSWPVYWCTDWEAMPFANRTNKQVQSSYGVAVWVLGPRCVDPWTGQKNENCINQVKQILG